MRRTPDATARADLRESLSGPLPVALDHSDDLAERAADLLAWVWDETVLPSWPVRRHIIEADVVARLGSVGRHLKVLLEARLIQRRRAGRSVLHSRSVTGMALVDAQAG